MAILTLVCVEMVRPTCPYRLWKKWKDQRARGDLDALNPDDIGGHIRVWRGQEDTRDWDRLVRGKQGDRWGLVSHRHEFIHVATDKLVDRTEDVK